MAGEKAAGANNGPLLPPKERAVNKNSPRGNPRGEFDLYLFADLFERGEHHDKFCSFIHQRFHPNTSFVIIHN